MSGKIGKRFHGPAALGNATAILYTVPASRRACIRHIHISNPSGASVDVTLGIGADAAGTRILDGFPIGADSEYNLYCKFDLEAAEVLRGHASTAATLVIVVDGDEEIFA